MLPPPQYMCLAFLLGFMSSILLYVAFTVSGEHPLDDAANGTVCERIENSWSCHAPEHVEG